MEDKKTQYWNDYYSSSDMTNRPSTFAEYCSTSHFNKKYRILELGSGNGRDAIFFAQTGNYVHGIDLSQTAINLNNQKSKELELQESLKFSCGDFSRLENYYTEDIEALYSRFTIHAIKKSSQDYLMKKSFELLSKDSLFFIEARTTKDPLYGQGKKVGKHEFETSHYRRFIPAEEFRDEAISIGYEVLHFEENNNLSIYRDDNPWLMRIILKR